MIRSKYPDHFNKKVNFNAVLHNRNSVVSITDFFKKEYGKVPSIGALNDMGIRPGMQDGFIFSDTIAGNITMGDSTPRHDKLQQALKVANIEEYVNSLPLGLNTKIGQEGV